MDASTWATVEEIFRDLLIFVAFMTVLLVVRYWEKSGISADVEFPAEFDPELTMLGAAFDSAHRYAKPLEFMSPQE